MFRPRIDLMNLDENLLVFFMEESSISPLLGAKQSRGSQERSTQLNHQVASNPISVKTSYLTPIS